MKTIKIITITIIILLSSTLFINLSNASNQTTYTLQSNGTINQTAQTELTVILRGICITKLNPNKIEINSWVDSYVANHSYATAVTLVDLLQHGVWWYGYSFSNTSGTWMGWSFQQLKTMINRFHYNGWNVGLETTGVAWNNQQEYNYITKQHPELAFTDANGLRATGIDNITASTKNPGSNRVVPDFFAKFSTDDPINNITAGTRLIDLYTNRLRQMITDGLEWDFWFGTDGWNGFNLRGYKWNTQEYSKCYSFSIQEINEYGNWSEAILPANWQTMNATQKVNAILSNQSVLDNWWYYWQIRFAQLYAQIKQVFIDCSRPCSFHLVGVADVSSEPGGAGNLGPTGMYNMSLLAQFNSVDYLYVNQEGTAYTGSEYSLGREQAYVGAVVKMQNLNLKPIIGLQPVDWTGKNYPLWEVKQEYLAQAVNYIWHNGQQYRVSAPNIIMMQYPNGDSWTGWTQQDAKNLFVFIEEMVEILDNTNPIWLGPTYPIPDTKSGSFGLAWWSLNFSIAQWAWSANLQNNPEAINERMGTFILDESLVDSGPRLTGLYDIMVNKLWATDKLNLWYFENRGSSTRISSIWQIDETQTNSAFHITPSAGNSLNYTISSDLVDPTAKSIASGFEGTVYSINSPKVSWYNGVYRPEAGFTTIANFESDNPNTIAIGYYKNDTTGKFLLTHLISQPLQGNFVQLLPRSIVNKLLYWICDSPINSSEPLIDMKILENEGKIIIPMTNQKDVGNNFGSSNGWPITSTFSLDAETLGLGTPDNYKIYWSNSGTIVEVTNWKNLSITLNGMADVLVILPKND